MYCAISVESSGFRDMCLTINALRIRGEIFFRFDIIINDISNFLSSSCIVSCDKSSSKSSTVNDLALGNCFVRR